MTTYTLDLPDNLSERVSEEARRLNISPEERIVEALQGTIAPAQNFVTGVAEEGLNSLKRLLESIPAVTFVVTSQSTEPQWWVKFGIDIEAKVAWYVVQGLGFVLNYLSLEERLPTVFRPVSPPPCLNGGPSEFLAWVIEAQIPFLDAGVITKVLSERLPNPVEDANKWIAVDAEEE